MSIAAAGIPLSCKGRTLRDGTADIHHLGLTAMEVQFIKVNPLTRLALDEEVGKLPRELPQQLVVSVGPADHQGGTPSLEALTVPIRRRDSISTLTWSLAKEHADLQQTKALARALDASDEFNWNESGEQYVWLRGSSKVPGMANTVLGSLTPEGSRLRVHVISDERAKRLRSLLDRIAPAALRYRLSEIHDFSKIGQGAPSATRISDIPPEVESQILAEFSGRYYRAWLDEQIPALGGRTPRHAATLKTQRSKVAALLREIEMRSPKAHVPDTAWMWEELGLTDLR